MTNSRACVVWREGMLLDPQHFQQQDRAFAGMLNGYIKALNPNAWGVLDIAVNRDALLNGTFVLSRLSCIFQNGVQIEIPSLDEAPVALSELNQYFTSRSKLTIFLAIPKQQDGGNVELSQNGAAGQSRFTTKTVSIKDDTYDSGDQERSVTRVVDVLRANLKLLHDGESRDGWDTIPVAQVLNKDGQLELNDRFLPPSLSLRTSPYFSQVLERVLNQLLSKANALSERRNEIDAQQAISPDDARVLGFYGAIASVMPLLSSLQQSLDYHPEKLFESLLSVAGVLNGFSRGASPPPWHLPGYEHEDGGACFHALETKILNLLRNAEVKSEYFEMSLEASASDSNYWVSSIRTSVFQRSVVFLKVRTVKHAEDYLKEEIPRQIRVASPDLMHDIRRTKARALPLKHLARIPAGMPRDEHSTYFELDQQNRFWESVLESGEIAIYAPPRMEGLELSLVGKTLS